MNYLYGTFLALRGLRAAGISENEPSIQRGIEFVRAYQNRDGGWGESCASYDEGRFMPNPSTPSQTAWAILALLAGGDIRSESLHNGVDYLVRTQRSDGTWNEEYCTGTGFPRVFYLAYTDYRNTFPLLALSLTGKRWRHRMKFHRPDPDGLKLSKAISSVLTAPREPPMRAASSINLLHFCTGFFPALGIDLEPMNAARHYLGFPISHP